MGVFFAFFFGILVIENVNNKSDKTNVEKSIQVNDNKVVKKNTLIIETKPEPKKNEPIKEKLKPEPIKNEIKTEPKEPEPIKNEIKTEPKEPEPIKKEIKTEPIKEELKTDSAKDTENSNQSETGWLNLALYILGPIFVLVVGKYFYTKLRNNSKPITTNDYMRKKFKEDEVQPGSLEQQPTEEEPKPENAEQQPTEEEPKPENAEQQPTEEEPKPENAEQQPTEEEPKPENAEQELLEDDKDTNK